VKQLPLPIYPSLVRSPELAPLAILDTALAASESALMLASSELHYDDALLPTRRSVARRATALILLARRLATSIAAYRDALDRDARRMEREFDRRSF